MKKIYLAGPDVFLQNSVEVSEIKQEICDRYGFIGCYPLDNEINTSDKSPNEIGVLISEANEKLIRSCDIIVANLMPFRGPSADVGTIYEIGFGKALGKICYGYSNTNILFKQRVNSHCNTDDCMDSDGMLIEDFGLVDNLMIDGGIKSSGGFILSEDIEDEDDFSLFERLISSIAHNIIP